MTQQGVSHELWSSSRTGVCLERHAGIPFTIKGEMTILMLVAGEQFKIKTPQEKTPSASMKWLLYIICRISTGDDTWEVLLGTSSHQQKDKSLDPQRCLPALHTLWLQTLKPHSREGVGSAQALKDTQHFADSSNLFNLWLGPGMSTMEWCYGSWQQYLRLL